MVSYFHIKFISRKFINSYNVSTRYVKMKYFRNNTKRMSR